MSRQRQRDQIRGHMAATGHNYTTARRELLKQPEQLPVDTVAGLLHALTHLDESGHFKTTPDTKGVRVIDRASQQWTRHLARELHDRFTETELLQAILPAPSSGAVLTVLPAIHSLSSWVPWARLDLLGTESTWRPISRDAADGIVRARELQLAMEQTRREAHKLALATTTLWPKLEVGQRLRFADSRQAMCVRAVSADGRFVVATRPFNARRTVLYTVIDFQQGIRGRDDHYGVGYETDEECRSAIERLADGEIEVSFRHWEWLRYSDTQPDPATARMLPWLRIVTAAAPTRGYNDHQPRAVSETMASTTPAVRLHVDT